MAPIKFEENIKDKLEKRTIEPSRQAWDSLSDRLSSDSKGTSNKTVWFLGIAASVVGILFMLNMFFSTSVTNIQEPVIVDTETIEVDVPQKKNNLESKEPIVDIEADYLDDASISEEKLKIYETRKASVVPERHQVKNTSIANVSDNREPEESVSNSIIELPSTEIELTQIDRQEPNKKTETDIDALLLKAQEKIANTNTITSRSIDPNALLQDVEEDIDESFRAKVFETIKTNYKKVKTAVAERNN
jgi:hypothetical protein